MVNAQEQLRQALQHLSDGQWQSAHVLVQDGKTQLHSLIHGLVHRMEGDLGNAAYWYNKAQQDLPKNTLEEEIARLQAMIPN